ncbi:hypothetical protein [Burkholderia latens]|uniref:hypothetical protein n=1 Tax=Burkholderia latens TaxID=488446 RepID=UPI001FC8AB38|nr:hypothetical protein [Burkholderia latens]
MNLYRYPLLIVLLATASALSACASADPSPRAVGSDRDAHGCIGSAGYSWCQATQRCERPWELAKQKGFAVSSENFANFCQSGSAP